MAIRGNDVRRMRGLRPRMPFAISTHVCCAVVVWRGHLPPLTLEGSGSEWRQHHCVHACPCVEGMYRSMELPVQSHTAASLLLCCWLAPAGRCFYPNPQSAFPRRPECAEPCTLCAPLPFSYPPMHVSAPAPAPPPPRPRAQTRRPPPPPAHSTECGMCCCYKGPLRYVPNESSCKCEVG